MEELIKTGRFALDALKAAGAQEAQVSVSGGETEEFNVDAGEFSLIRSVFSSGISMKAIKDKKKGTAAVNQLDKESVDAAVAECMTAVFSGAEDEAVSIAQKEENLDFTDGVLTPDKEKFFDSLIRFTEDVKSLYPRIMLEQVIASYSHGRHALMNTNGVCLTEEDGSYSVSVMFSAHDGENSTSFNYFDIDTLDPGARLIDLGMARTMFERAEKELETKPFNGKFLGTAVFSPLCMGDVIGVIMGSFCGDISLIEGTSPWKDKLGEKVASENFTLSVIPHDDRIICGEKITCDGYRSENYDVIENGVLKSFCLSEYAARKTGGLRAKSSSGCVEVRAGENPMEEMIKGIEKGVLVCRFSGGEPADNGDFSGVAKNSFLIENGRITCPISETMISGNFADMLKNVYAVSSDVLCDGTAVMPYVAFGGVTVSGK